MQLRDMKWSVGVLQELYNWHFIYTKYLKNPHLFLTT